MRHVGNLLLSVVDGGNDRARELLEGVSKLVFLWSGFASLRAALGLCSNATIGVKTTERAIALAQDATTLLDQRLNVVDELIFVKLVAWCAVSLLDVL